MATDTPASPKSRELVRYKVRSASGGELMYESLLHVEQAYLAGLVEPDDEIAPEGSSDWKKASAMPQLAKLRRMERTLAGSYVPLVVLATVLAVAALVFLIRGQAMVALVLAIILSAVLFRVTYNASRPNRR